MMLIRIGKLRFVLLSRVLEFSLRAVPPAYLLSKTKYHPFPALSVMCYC
jgi:hypothetical protein